MLTGLMYHVEEFEARASSQVFAEILEAAQLADRLGIDEVWYAEHHFGRHLSHMPAPLILATWVAARTERLRVGTAITVLPLHHPLEIAEQVAVLDVLTGGRVTIGFGSGASPNEFDAFGADHSERHAIFAEALAVILRAWSGEPFTHQGPRYSIPEIRVVPRPLQPIGQLAWLGASSPPTAELAGRHGLGLMLPRGRPVEGYVPIVAAYQAARAAAGFDPGPVSISRNVLVAPTTEEAQAIGLPSLRAFCQRWHPNDPLCGASDDELCTRLQFVIGDPDECVAQLRTLAATTGMTHLSIQPSWDGMSHAASLRSIELLGERVLPYL